MGDGIEAENCGKGLVRFAFQALELAGYPGSGFPFARDIGRRDGQQDRLQNGAEKGDADSKKKI